VATVVAATQRWVGGCRRGAAAAADADAPADGRDGWCHDPRLHSCEVWARCGGSQHLGAAGAVGDDGAAIVL
ncbi:hypothetical protein MNEG_2435, partial [Monoraphidium neglectum]